MATRGATERHQHRQHVILSSCSPARWILVLAAILYCCQRCSSTGGIEVHFINYYGRCYENWGTNKCDPYFNFCLSRPQTGSLSVSRARCHYGVTGSAHGQHYDNTNRMHFEDKRDILGMANPWKVKIGKFFDSEIMLVANVRNHNRIRSDKHISTWGMTLAETVYPSREVSQWQSRSMTDGNHRLRFKIRLFCDPHFYPPSCDVYCNEADSDRYFCDANTGEKICRKGWTGKDCDRDIDECEDYNVCGLGQCINQPGGYECDCPDGYIGTNCETRRNPCLSLPCQHGGECFSHPDRDIYICQCQTGWEGTTCSQRENPCKNQPCQNGGHCISNNAKTAYHCECSYPYEGSNCDRIHTTTTITTTTTTPSTTTSTTTTTPTTTTTTTTTTSTTTPPTTTTSTNSPTTTITSTTTAASTTTAMSTTTGMTEEVTAQSLVVAKEGHSSSSLGGLEHVGNSRQHASGDDSSLEVWQVGLMTGFVLLLLVLCVLFFMVRRRRRKQSLSPTSSVIYFEKDEVTYSGDHQNVSSDSSDNTNIVPSQDRNADVLRELPPIPDATSSSSAFLEADGYSRPRPMVTHDTLDETEGAVGGKPVDDFVKSKDSDEMTVKLSETLRRYKAGQGRANAYADFRTLSMGRENKGEVPAEDSSELSDHEDEVCEEFNPYEDLDAALRAKQQVAMEWTGPNDNEEDDHYNTLDEVKETGHPQFDDTVKPEMDAGQDGAYSVPTKDTKMAAASPETSDTAPSKDLQTKPGAIKPIPAATNPMYDSLPKSSPPSVEYAIPPVRIRRDK